MISIYNEPVMQRWFNAIVVCETALGRLPEPYSSRMVNDPQTYFDGFTGYVRRHHSGRLIDESCLYTYFWRYVRRLRKQDELSEELVRNRTDLY